MKSSPAGPILEINKVDIKAPFFIISTLFTLFLLPLLLLGFLLIILFVFLGIFAFLEVLKYGFDIADVSELRCDHEGRAAGGVQFVGVTAVGQEEPDDVRVRVGCCVVDQVATVLVWEREGRTDLKESF